MIAWHCNCSFPLLLLHIHTICNFLLFFSPFSQIYWIAQTRFHRIKLSFWPIYVMTINWRMIAWEFVQMVWSFKWKFVAEHDGAIRLCRIADYVARYIDCTHSQLICTIMKLRCRHGDVCLFWRTWFFTYPSLSYDAFLVYLKIVIKQNVNRSSSLHICLHDVVDANVWTCSIFYSDLLTYNLV